MSPVCPGIKRDGGRCTAGVRPGETWCYNHDPGRAEERRRAASRAGKSKPSREVAALKSQARQVFEEVRGGTIPPKVGGVLVQALNAQARILELEARLAVLRREWMTREEAEHLVAVLREAVERHVPDPVVRDAIGRRIGEQFAE